MTSPAKPSTSAGRKRASDLAQVRAELRDLRIQVCVLRYGRIDRTWNLDGFLVSWKGEALTVKGRAYPRKFNSFAAADEALRKLAVATI